MLGRCISYWNCPFVGLDGDMLIFQWCTFLHPDLSTTRDPSKVPGASTILRGPKIFEAIGTLTTCDLRRRPHPHVFLQGPLGGRWWFGHPTHWHWTHKKKSAKIQTPKIHTLMIYIYNSTDSYHVSTKKCDMSRHVDLNLLVFFLMGFF